MPNVRFTAYVLPETMERIHTARGRRPIGHAIDDAFAVPVSPVAKLIERKTDRVPVRPHSGKPPQVIVHRAQTTTPMITGPRGAHPVSCPCEACTLARLDHRK